MPAHVAMGAGSTDKSVPWLGEILGQKTKFVCFAPRHGQGAGGGVMDDDVGGVLYFSGPSGPRLGRNRDV